MNHVLLIGRLTSNIDLKKTDDGKSYTNFKIAVTRSFKDSDGNYGADFVDCFVYGQQADNMAQYLGKGSQLAVYGEIRVKSYNASDGTTKWNTKIDVKKVKFLDSSKRTSDIQVNDSVEDPFKDFGSEVIINDDDLPF